MHNAIAHHLLTDATSLFPSPNQLGFWELSGYKPVYILGMVFWGVEYPSGPLGHLSWLCSLPVSIENLLSARGVDKGNEMFDLDKHN